MSTPTAKKSVKLNEEVHTQYVPYLYNIDRAHPDRTGWNWLNLWPRQTLKRKLYQRPEERERAEESNENPFPGTNTGAVNRYRKAILALKKQYPNAEKDLSEEDIRNFKRRYGLLNANAWHAKQLQGRLDKLRDDLAVPDLYVRSPEVPEPRCVGAGCLPLEWEGGFTKKNRATRRRKQRSKRR
jgi:hypothetical protein